MQKTQSQDVKRNSILLDEGAARQAMLRSNTEEHPNVTPSLDLRIYKTCFQEFCKAYDESEGNVIYASIIAYGKCIDLTEAKTNAGILNELNLVTEFFKLKSMHIDEQHRFKSRLSFKAITALYLNLIRKLLGTIQHSGKSPVGSGFDIQMIKRQIKEKTRELSEHSLNCIDLIQRNCCNVLRPGMTILVHSYSKSVAQILQSAVDRGIRIQVIATQSQPMIKGRDVQEFCDQQNIPCKTILDSAVGLCMKYVDCVFVGSEAVLENGGIVNRIGTYTIALCAKAYNKPFYVCAESFKFLKRFILDQNDIFGLLDEDMSLLAHHNQDKCKNSNENNKYCECGYTQKATDLTTILVDYTPPEYISELFTDIGIFTPAAVSDELIKFFQ